MSMRTAIVTTVLLFASLVAQANMELTLKSNTTTLPVKGVTRMSGDKGKPSTRTVHLTLGARWLQWDDGSNQRVYDFGKRIVIRVDSEGHRLVEKSLYAELTGREMELDNRLMLANALESGGVKDNPMAPTIAEHQLSLRRDAPRASGIERKSANGERDYVWHDKELFAYSTEVVPLPATARDLYLRYIRYFVGGHPEILDDLQMLDGIPKWIRHSDPSYGDVQRIEVMEIRETVDAPYVLPALEKATLKDPGAAAAAAAVAASTPESRSAAATGLLAAANAAADEGKPLEAILGYLEWNLMIGDELPPDFNKRKELMVHDANVESLVGALHAENAEQARSYIATLVRLAPLAGEKAYVTGIFRADMEQGLSNRETATSLFVAALTKDPFITGVWKDLGDSLDTGYDAGDTWRCYEIARLIEPTHPLLADVARRESRLAKEHPEYF